VSQGAELALPALMIEPALTRVECPISAGSHAGSSTEACNARCLPWKVIFAARVELHAPRYSVHSQDGVSLEYPKRHISIFLDTIMSLIYRLLYKGSRFLIGAMLNGILDFFGLDCHFASLDLHDLNRSTSSGCSCLTEIVTN
jgi:hypothetical protein